MKTKSILFNQYFIISLALLVLSSCSGSFSGNLIATWLLQTLKCNGTLDYDFSSDTSHVYKIVLGETSGTFVENDPGENQGETCEIQIPFTVGITETEGGDGTQGSIVFTFAAGATCTGIAYCTQTWCPNMTNISTAARTFTAVVTDTTLVVTQVTGAAATLVPLSSMYGGCTEGQTAELTFTKVE